MGILFLVIKSLLILLFLVMFLRTNKPAWGVGLLTVTSAILLDAFLGTLGREEMMEELGFFFYFLIGVLIAGAAAWFWVIMKPFINRAMPTIANIDRGGSNDNPPKEVGNEITQDDTYSLILKELLTSLTPDDLQDLLFDLAYQDRDINLAGERHGQLAKTILRYTSDQGELDKLGAAIDRIKSPIPPENLPRLEKINSKTPPTILRHYLLNVYALEDLDELRRRLELDSSGDERNIKKQKVRHLLSELYDRNEIDNLIEFLQASAHKDVLTNDEVQE